ncbi:MAG: pre-peptidase C-terminal domain-containing protein, partial [Acidobacteriota bacterium]
MSRQTTLHILRAAIEHFWTTLLIVMVATLSVTGQTPAVEGRERGSGEALSGRDEVSIRHFREIAERLREGGTIPVIVRLRDEGHRAEVEQLLGQMTGDDAASVKRFKYIPYVALRIDRGGLEQLRGSSLVSDIQEDNAVHPGIATRRRVVTGDQSRLVGDEGAGRTLVLIGGALDRTHPELAGRLVAEGCYSTPDASRGIVSLCAGEERTDCAMSGAACATETGRAVLAVGRESLAARASLISLQIFSRIERGEGCPDGGAGCLVAFDSDVIRALERVHELRQERLIGAVSLNLSNLRLVENCDETRSAMKEALALLSRRGITTVIAEEEGGQARSCVGGVISPSQIPGFGGEASELAGLLVAGRETLAGALPGSRLGEELRRLASLPDSQNDQSDVKRDGEQLQAGSTGETALATAIPAVPTELLGTALSTSQIQLTWRDNSTNEGGFLIRRKRLNDSAWVAIATVIQNTTRYTDVGLFPGTTYLYSVSAINLEGESLRSNETMVELPIYNFRLYGTNGVPVNSSLHLNNYEYYRVSIPYGATQFLVQTIGSGDSDLYVRYGSVPGLFKFDCRSRLDTSSDRCVFSYPQAGDWYIMIYSNSRSVVNYTLEATYLTGIENNRPVGPTNLFATATSATQINLSWEDNSTNEVGFNIRRRVGLNGTPIDI